MNRHVTAFAALLIGLFAASAHAKPSTNPTNYLGSTYVFTNSGAGTVTLPANIDYICIPRTNISVALTAAICTNDLRSMLYFFVKKAHAVVDAQPSTNTFSKLTVNTGTMSGTVSNMLRQTFSQTFFLDGSGLAPAGE